MTDQQPSTPDEQWRRDEEWRRFMMEQQYRQNATQKNIQSALTVLLVLVAVALVIWAISANQAAGG
ncbi:hypothetical protein [Blastococcus sp. SYSU D00813]